MNTGNRSIQLMVLGVAAVVFALPFTAYQTLCAQSATRLVDEPAQHRLVVVLDPTDEMADVTIGGRIAHAAMLNRFRVDVMDSAGLSIVADGQWDVTLFAEAAVDGARPVMESMIQLGARTRDISVPKPFGYRLGEMDSLHIVARFHQTTSSQKLHLRLIIDYSPLGRADSRLAVRSLHSSAPSDTANESVVDGNAADRSWEWQPAANGEIEAIAGLPTAGLTGFVLQDVATGKVLWRLRPAGHESRTGAAQPGQAIRLCVAVEAGRVYRLTASYTGAAAATIPSGSGAALAMVLPSRTPSS